ncbi:hypothetical protein [Zunongwangia sp.]|uniref:hypothetical protein n=1 Tax=Zunongwangia sp. TaxID=1965325 RepID=UPI003AA9478A
MKKIIILLIGVFSLYACEIEDDGPTLIYNFAPITGADFPEHFTTGEIYDFPVTFIKNNSCSAFAGFDISREINGNTRDIYIYAVTKEAESAGCKTEVTEETQVLQQITITGSNETEYTFHLWEGVSEETGKNSYLEIKIPVKNTDTN